jgi:hypothetical protein
MKAVLYTMEILKEKESLELKDTYYDPWKNSEVKRLQIKEIEHNGICKALKDARLLLRHRC